MRFPYPKAELAALLDLLRADGVEVERSGDTLAISGQPTGPRLREHRLPADLIEVVSWVTIAATTGSPHNSCGLWSTVRTLPAAWLVLLDDLRGKEFTTWLEQSTGIELTGLPRSIGLYTHRSGYFLSVHKDKPTKAITAILYLNDRWPNEAGGPVPVLHHGGFQRRAHW
ncbi:hypothetical protein QC334_32890 [Streptomyces sp. DH18]|uniref:hypothetical protein n=1 Tax=Streptomyces sp. DH18 TaxID=3040126 RepID=UPI0024414115|nr:hypothetical protein [Streptomyces sp. DH18]MDG9687472.1 hypothetical protein [Streptomyces sp. DH18]